MDTGFTPDLKSRIAKHQKGLVKATKHRIPVKLIYYEAYESEIDARRREIYLKGGKGKGELKIQFLLDEYNMEYISQYIFDDLRGKKKRHYKFDFGIIKDNKLF